MAPILFSNSQTKRVCRWFRLLACWAVIGLICNVIMVIVITVFTTQVGGPFSFSQVRYHDRYWTFGAWRHFGSAIAIVEGPYDEMPVSNLALNNGFQGLAISAPTLGVVVRMLGVVNEQV